MTNSALLRAALALSVLPLWAATAQAQQARPNYNIGDALREAEKPRPPVDKPQAVPVIPQEEEEPFSLPDGGTIRVQDFRLEGAELVDEAEVQALLEPYRNRDLTLTDVYEAAAKVTNLYRAKGFLVAKAYIPKQDAGSGTLLIKVVVGRHGQVSQDNGSPVHDFLLQGMLESAMPEGEPVAKDGVERAMLLVSDLPGAQMPTIAITPGATPGTSDFVVKTEPANRVAGYVLGDNFGSRYTGRDRLSFGLDVNSPLGLGDKLSLSGMTAEAAGLQNGRAAYAFPLSYSGLRLELAASRTTYKLGDIYHDLEATGVATIWEGTLSYPLIRTRAESLSVSFNGAEKRLEDKASGSTLYFKHAHAGTLGAQNQTSGTVFGFNTTTDASSSLLVGKLEFPDITQLQTNQAGANTEGLYSKFNASLGGTVSFTDEWSVAGILKAQKSLLGKNLDGNEQMSISGSSGVKSYAEGVTGDNGYLFNIEGKYTLPGIEDFSHAIGLFSELGRVYFQNSGYTSNRHGTQLSDVGVAYYTNFQYSTGRYLVGKLLMAQTVGSTLETGEKSPRTKLLGQIGFTF